jgi:hypothetical protein
VDLGNGALPSLGRRAGGCRGPASGGILNKARAPIGLPDLHFHDLRHTDCTLAETGRVAPGASFGRTSEHDLPAVQRTGHPARDGADLVRKRR